MIKKITILVVSALVFAGCIHNRFDRVKNTPASRYDIVYDDDRCGVFDNKADSLVTLVEYDSLSFLQRDEGLDRSRYVQLHQGWDGWNDGNYRTE